MTDAIGINLELFPCAGGMAEGFRRAGIHFDVAIEWMPNHCDSYEQNLGHRPLCMDVNDFLKLVRLGTRPRVKLLVADPPCTPWSHAGKRKGIADERDMLVATCEIIKILQPDAFLIGNVPGLDDSKNLSVVQKHIGGLAHHGYCTGDFARLDAADFGVPQHRHRPFWYGHRPGTPCIQWPEPTHGDPAVHDAKKTDQMFLPMVKALTPWVTCRHALQHLPPEKIGRLVKVKKRETRDAHPPSPIDGAAMTIKATNGSQYITVNDENHAMSKPDAPARTLTRNTHGDGSVIVLGESGTGETQMSFIPKTKRTTTGETDRERRKRLKIGPNAVAQGDRLGSMDELSVTITDAVARPRAGADKVICVDDASDMFPPSKPDEPAKALRASGRTAYITVNDKHAPSDADEPSSTIRGGGEGHSSPNTVIMLNAKHPNADLDKPAPTMGAKQRGQGAQVLSLPQGERIGDADEPAVVMTSTVPRVRQGADKVLAWPWDRPSTTVQADERIPPPGHHDADWATRSLLNAVVISEDAAALLQGFPESWKFIGKTKKARWSQIGQAMPPPLAHAVALSVRKQMGLEPPSDPATSTKPKRPKKSKKTTTTQETTQ